MYTVRRWDNDEIISEYPKLALAKRYCRGQGHTGEYVNGRYAPIAYVADVNGYLVYNPTFRDPIKSGALSGLINSLESDWF